MKSDADWLEEFSMSVMIRLCISVIISALIVMSPASVYAQSAYAGDHTFLAINKNDFSASLKNSKIKEHLDGCTVCHISVGVHAYDNTKLTLKDGPGANLDSNDVLCVGKTYELTGLEPAAEFAQMGGPEDSPPVVWAESLSVAKKQIEEGKFDTPLYDIYACAWRGSGLNAPFAYPMESVYGPEACIQKASVICEKGCRVDSDGAQLNNNVFVPRREGNIKLEHVCDAKCILFVNRPAGSYPVRFEFTYARGDTGYTGSSLGYASLSKAYGWIDLYPITYGTKYGAAAGTAKDVNELSLRTTFNAKAVNYEEPKLRMVSFTIPEEQLGKSEVVARIELKNAGGDKAFFDGIDFDVPGEVLYKPKGSIAPGETVEILYEVAASDLVEKGGLNLDMKYETENLGCYTSKNREASFESKRIKASGLTLCKASADCLTGQECCAGACRNAAEGVCDDIDSDGIPDTWVPFER